MVMMMVRYEREMDNYVRRGRSDGGYKRGLLHVETRGAWKSEDISK